MENRALVKPLVVVVQFLDDRAFIQFFLFHVMPYPETQDGKENVDRILSLRRETVSGTICFFHNEPLLPHLLQAS